MVATWGHDFARSLEHYLAAQNDEIIDSGEWSVGGIPFQYVETGTYRREQQTGTIRFVFTMHSKELWLYAKLAGYSDTDVGCQPRPVYAGADFEHTKNIFGTLRELSHKDA